MELTRSDYPSALSVLRVTSEGGRVKRVAILLMVAVPLIFAPGVAAAKGNIPARGYAVLTGPGLSHPIVFSAPWDSSKGGYYGDEAEVFLGVANYSGATPAAKDLTQGAGSVPDGVVPLPSAPARDELGPKYRLTWFRDYLGDVAEQDVYPYARGGPVVYTFPSSRQALINIFGRFQDPAHMWTGWGQETPYGRLRDALEFNGLPSTTKLDAVMNSPWYYRWPDGAKEPFDRAEWYQVSGLAGEARVLLAHTNRYAWNADRERYVVFARLGREESTTFYPWTEFVQTDEGHFAALIPDPTHPRAALKYGMQLPTRFSGRRVERTDALYDSAQDSPTLRLAVDESDADAMIEHGYWVAEMRGRLRG